MHNSQILVNHIFPKLLHKKRRIIKGVEIVTSDQNQQLKYIVKAKKPHCILQIPALKAARGRRANK